MKCKLEVLFVSMILLVSCKEPELSKYSKEQEALLNQNGWVINTDTYDPVSTFEFPVYYSKIDTVHMYQVSHRLNPRLVFNHLENDSAKIRITLNDQLFSDVKSFWRQKDSTLRIWENGLILDFANNKLKTGDKIEAVVSLNEKNYKYYFNALEVAIHSDVLGVNFGDTK